jgi:hypothetical protein
MKLTEEITNTTSKFIHWFLHKYNEANPYEVFVLLREIRKQQKTKRGKDRMYPTSKSIHHYFFIMKELGLIEVARLGEKTPLGYKKYYRIVEKYDKHKAWGNPQKYYKMVKGQ